MRDLPLFETQYGIAGLVLREIPYQKVAYVHILQTDSPKELLGECIGFCKAVGAEQIYAKGDPYLENFPLHTKILKMQCLREQLSQTKACLYPVVQQTLQQWREMYLQKIQRVPNAAWMTRQDAEQMLAQGEGYFVHQDGKMLGFGRVKGNEITWVAATEKGAGKDVVCALANAVLTEDICLHVASDNTKALHLYQSLGFVITEEASQWYKVF